MEGLKNIRTWLLQQSSTFSGSRNITRKTKPGYRVLFEGDGTTDKIETAESTLSAQEGSKLDSDVEMSLKLKKTPKLIDQIRRLSRNRDLVLVAFKLLVNAGDEEKQRAVKKLFEGSRADIVVRNEISEVQQIQHIAQIFDTTKMLREVKDKNELASALEMIVGQQVAQRKKAADVDIQSQEQLK